MKAQQVRIAEPCKVDWKSMTPAEGGRFCGDCKKVVRNLSQMTEREAKKLLRAASDGQLCVRFVYDANGKIWFGKDAPKADPLIPAGMLSRAKRVAAMATMALATQACDAVTSAMGADDEPEEYERLMGALAIDDEHITRGPVDVEGGSDAGAADASDTSDAATSDGSVPDATAPDGGGRITLD